MPGTTAPGLPKGSPAPALVPPGRADRPEPDVAIPAANPLRAWAEATLGPRPDVTATVVDAYPGCVAQLRGQASDQVSEAAARACAGELSVFHQSMLIPYFVESATYQRKLEATEASLRRGGLSGEERDQHIYVVNESERLNGQEHDAVAAIDQRLLEDIRVCRRAQCRL